MAKDERETRQGEKGKPLLYVLVVALMLAVVAGAGVLTWQGSNDSTSRKPEAPRATTTSAANPTDPGLAEPKAQ